MKKKDMAESHSSIASHADATNRSRSSPLAIDSQTGVWSASAPGRVNLIGEHTDYNQGYTLPLAIERYTKATLQLLATQSVENRKSYFYSQAFDQTAVWSCDGARFVGQFSGPPAPERLEQGGGSPELSDPANPPAWSKYIAGVFNQFHQLGYQLPSCQLQIESDVPLGGGLSSSAALEVAVAMVLKDALRVDLTGLQIALLCQAAEHDYAAVPCGLMDQMSSVCGRRDHLMLLDCRSNQMEHIELPEELVVLVVNSNIKHSLADGEYRQRRWQCEEACRRLQIESLRDIDLLALDRHRHLLDDVLFRRARHVVSEISRTIELASCIRNHQWLTAGELMYFSHQSMRDDYEITCPEVDQLVEIARGLGPARGVYGARMTGGGFGGCVIGLVDRKQAEFINQSVLLAYKQRTGIDADSFLTRPAAGGLDSSKLLSKNTSSDETFC